MARPARSCSPREQLFIEAYCGAARFNATAAARMAGYSARSHQSLRQQASRLLTRAHIARAIAERLEARRQQLQMDGDEALGHLSTIARGDIRQVLPEGHPLRALPDEAAALIKAVRPTKYGLVIELYDRVRALELLAKATGTLTERHTVSWEDVLEASYRGAEPPP